MTRLACSCAWASVTWAMFRRPVVC